MDLKSGGVVAESHPEQVFRAPTRWWCFHGWTKQAQSRWFLKLRRFLTVFSSLFYLSIFLQRAYVVWTLCLFRHWTETFCFCRWARLFLQLKRATGLKINSPQSVWHAVEKLVSVWRRGGGRAGACSFLQDWTLCSRLLWDQLAGPDSCLMTRRSLRDTQSSAVLAAEGGKVEEGSNENTRSLSFYMYSNHLLLSGTQVLFEAGPGDVLFFHRCLNKCTRCLCQNQVTAGKSMFGFKNWALSPERTEQDQNNLTRDAEIK